jgi:hypothetical protein
MDRVAFGTIGDLFGWDQDELAAAFEQITVFIEGFESDLVFVRAGLASGFNPSFTKSLEVPLHALPVATLLNVFDIHPFGTLLQDVVVGDGQKVVAILTVPIGNDFGKIISIAPERVGMEISFPPSGLGIGIYLLCLRGKSVDQPNWQAKKSQCDQGRGEKS